MRRLLALLVCGALVACGSENGTTDGEVADNPPSPGILIDDGDAQDTAAELWPASVQLPRLGTVGDLPPADQRVVLAIGKDGATWVDGTPGDLLALDRALAAAADRGDAKNLDLVIAGDAGVPWAAVQHVLQRAASKLVWRIWFAARHHDDSVGAIAVFLPRDQGIRTHGAAPVAPLLVVKIADGWPPSNPLALHVPFAPHAEGGGAVRIEAVPSAPLGTVLRVADVAAQEQCAGLTFLGTPGRCPDGLTGVVSALGEKRARRITIRSAEPAALPPLIPAATRATGPAGFTEPVDELMPEVEQPEMVEPEDD